MTRKPLRRFWKALDEIPEATTDRREWSLRLGDEWLVGASYLRSTGKLVREIGCPSAGGDGCPRKLVKHIDGRFRAVCGNKPAECDSVDLTREEVTCLALDRAKLAATIGAILNADRDSGRAGNGVTVVVGSHGVASGVRIPIILAIPGPTEIASVNTLTELDVGSDPAAIVVPTPRSISEELKAALIARGHAILNLTDITTVKDHRLAGVRPAVELLTDVREKVLARHAPAEAGRAWLLPAGARWEDLTFDFTADEVVNVRFREETRRFEPEQFGMKSKKNGRPTSLWVVLRSIARQAGSLTWKDPDASTKVKKHKQLLANRLTSLFGIEGDPIPWRVATKAYQTRFMIRDSMPRRSDRR